MVLLKNFKEIKTMPILTENIQLQDGVERKYNDKLKEQRGTKQLLRV